jgi:hypothetical protein
MGTVWKKDQSKAFRCLKAFYVYMEYAQAQHRMNFIVTAVIMVCIAIWLVIASKNKSKFGVT